jgi:hypothetical protein
MRRITFSCPDKTSAQLDWLCKRTLRKPSNLLALLVHHEIDRHLKEMPEQERLRELDRIYAECPSVHPA